MSNLPDLSTSVPEWLIEYPQLYRTFEQLEIDYSCGGKSLETACRERGLDPRAILRKLYAQVGPADDEL